MEEKVVIEIVLLSLCCLGLIAVIIFILRTNDEGINYSKLLKELDEQKENNLDILNLGNKEIDKIERKILECKKELNMRLFKK